MTTQIESPVKSPFVTKAINEIETAIQNAIRFVGTEPKAKPFSENGCFDIKGNRLTIVQAQDVFLSNQKIVVNVVGEKLHKLFYGILHLEDFRVIAYQWGEDSKTEWYAIQHISADPSVKWWSICRVNHCPNGELIVNQFPGKFQN